MFGELQGQSFSGYLELNLAKDEGAAIAQMVLKEGAPVLIKDSLNENCSIEVHSEIENVDMLLTFFSKAKVDAEQVNVDQIIEDLENEEKKAREAAERGAADRWRP